MSQQDNELIKYEEKLPNAGVDNDSGYSVGLRIWDAEKVSKGRGSFHGLWIALRFLLLVFGFFGLFALIMICVGINPEDNADSVTEDKAETVGAVAETTEIIERTDTELPQGSMLIQNETDAELDFDELIKENYSLSSLFSSSAEAYVLILHSHSSEYVCSGMSVVTAGDALTQLISSGGISCIHSNAEHDKDTAFGAYSKMKETVLKLSEEKNAPVIVIDLHDSDTGAPLTFTVGSGSVFGWRENLRFAVALCKEMSSTSVLRVVPGKLGQDAGGLILHVGIGGKGYGKEDARKVVSELANAIIKICTKDPP